VLKRAATLLSLLAAVGAVGAAAYASHATIPAKWKNCTAVNRRYPHGVGRNHAHDATTGTPVTNFKRSTRIYNVAMSYNRSLDRDKDGIACEKN
jgi:hypothetical protein